MVVVKIAYFRDIYHHGLWNSLGSGLNGPRRCCLVLRIAFDSSPQSSSYTVYYVWWVYVELLLLGEESNRWKLFAVATALGFGVHTTATVYCAISQKKKFNQLVCCVAAALKVKKNQMVKSCCGQYTVVICTQLMLWCVL